MPRMVAQVGAGQRQRISTRNISLKGEMKLVLSEKLD
jgi:hypothetical protein